MITRLLLALLIFATPLSANCAELEVNTPVYSANADQYTAMQSGLPQFRLKLHSGHAYAVASMEQAQLFFVGQDSGGLMLYGLGAGVELPLIGRLNTGMDISMIYPERIRPASARNGDEGCEYYMDNVVGHNRRWERYRMELGSAIAVQLTLSYQLTRAIGLTTGYRFLQLPYTMYGESDGAPDYWTLRRNLNLSGYFAGISLEF